MSFWIREVQVQVLMTIEPPEAKRDDIRKKETAIWPTGRNKREEVKSSTASEAKSGKQQAEPEKGARSRKQKAGP